MSKWVEEAFDSSFVLGCFVVILVIALSFGVYCLKGWILMLLWNAILVPLFSFGALTFWWAVGIIVICSILFRDANTIKKNEGE